MIIESAEQVRNLTGSYYANNDFTKISHIISQVQAEVARVIGQNAMEWIENEGKDSAAADAARTAVAYMATMRFYRLNDISHENAGRKVKIDKDNEARPFEWQLARDDRMHLEEYYRALDRLLDELQEVAAYQQSASYIRSQALIIKDADSLSYLTGLDPSPWLYFRMVPFLADSQHYVEKAYGQKFAEQHPIDNEELQHAAQMAVALGAIALMGRRTSLQTMPYGLMKVFESDGGGNRREAAALDRLDDYLKHLSSEQHYWLNEMKQLRDEANGTEPTAHLQIPENSPNNKFMRL